MAKASGMGCEQDGERAAKARSLITVSIKRSAWVWSLAVWRRTGMGRQSPPPHPEKGTHYLAVDSSERRHSSTEVRTHLPGL